MAKQETRWYMGTSARLGGDFLFKAAVGLLDNLPERIEAWCITKLVVRPKSSEDQTPVLDFRPWHPAYFSAYTAEDRGVLGRGMFDWLVEASEVVGEEAEKVWSDTPKIEVVSEAVGADEAKRLHAQAKNKRDLAKALRAGPPSIVKA